MARQAALNGIPTDKFLTEEDDERGKPMTRNAKSWVLFLNQVFALLKGMTRTDYGLYEPLNIEIQGLPLRNYANDAAADAAGVPIGGLYHTSGTVKVRLV